MGVSKDGHLLANVTNQFECKQYNIRQYVEKSVEIYYNIFPLILYMHIYIYIYLHIFNSIF